MKVRRVFLIEILQVFASFRFICVSALNYLFGNMIFAICWTFSGTNFEYPAVATASTLIAAVFSYQTQARLIVKSVRVRKIINPFYLSIQLISLGLSFISVPFLANQTSLGYISAQFLWSAVTSFISICLIYLKESGLRIKNC